MNIAKKNFGMLSGGKKARLFILKAGELKLVMTNYGASLVALYVPASRQPSEDVVLGYGTLAGYASDRFFFGSTAGRYANRIANGTFTLNDRTYTLDKNDGNHTLHGGRRGLSYRLWKADGYEEKDGVFVRFEISSPDGDGGFPGKLKAVVSYGLSKSNELIVDYSAEVDKPCPVSLTNHAYFNLSGEGRGDILSHEAQLYASRYVAIGPERIPDGTLAKVEGGPFDLRTRMVIKDAMARSPGTREGFDHCFVADGEAGKLRPFAEIFDPLSRRKMRLFSTHPGFQFYTGNAITPLAGKPGSFYEKHSGLCLEPQFFPDTPNQAAFPPCIFSPERKFHERSLYSFDW
ncbi:MAG: galactose mutarotase [Spirochaetaceae bacterium]|jgi:aldose 1-epimerase|nr:galactose mutarotase [Spirochaetaceae bacterium]